MTREARILLVEDNKMDIELTLDAFKQNRLTNFVQVVTDGQQAIDYMMGTGEYADRTRYPLPDLILLDLKLPGIDGVEVLKELKGKPRLKRIPVVILTSSSDEGDRAMSYDSGANSYLVKPVDFKGFLEVVNTIKAYWLTLNIGPPKE